MTALSLIARFTGLEELSVIVSLSFILCVILLIAYRWLWRMTCSFIALLFSLVSFSFGICAQCFIILAASAAPNKGNERTKKPVPLSEKRKQVHAIKKRIY